MLYIADVSDSLQNLTLCHSSIDTVMGDYAVEVLDGSFLLLLRVVYFLAFYSCYGTSYIAFRTPDKKGHYKSQLLFSQKLSSHASFKDLEKRTL